MPPGGAADDAKGWCFLGAIGKAAGEGREGSTRAAYQQGLAGFDGMLKTNPLVTSAACPC